METSKAHFYAPKGVFFVEGEDAASFLQGQFSQNLQHPAGSRAYGLWLNHKGKILADSFILKSSETEFLVVSYFGEAALLQENLESRIIMDEVETRAPVSEWVGVSAWGNEIGRLLEIAGLERPNERQFSSNGSVYAFWGRRGKEPNLEIFFGNGVDQKELESEIAERGSQLLSAENVKVLAWRDGYFQVGRDIQESDLPQEVGLSEVAVSYVKGCYIGQEVMARLKSMGRPRRTLECVTVSKALEGEGPWKLLANDGSRAGELRHTVSDGVEILGVAMIKRSSTSEGIFEVDGHSGALVCRVAKGSAD